MFGIFRNILLFFIGVLLSVLFVYQGGVVYVLDALGYSGEETSAVTDPNARARLKDATSDEVQFARLLSPDVSDAQRIEILQSAISEGTLQSLRVIRAEALSKLPNFQSHIIPALRMSALDSLLQRMNESDWRDWSASHGSMNGGPSLARLYVDDVRNAQSEIGSYLESAAFILSGLYTSTEQGKPFALEEYSGYVLDNAEQLLSYRKQKATPARFLLSPLTAQEPYFLTVLERERGRMVGKYLDNNHRQINSGFELLRTIEPRLCTRETFHAISMFLLHIATKISPELRESFLYRELEHRVIENISRSSKQVRRIMAQLYIISAIDALDRGDKIQASKFLRESVALEPGLKVQKMLAGALQQVEGSIAAREEPRIAEEVPMQPKAKQRVVMKGDESEAPGTVDDERTLSPVFIVLVMVLCSSIPLLVVYFVKRMRRNYNAQLSEYDVPLPDHEAIGFTKPVDEQASNTVEEGEGRQWYKAVG